MPQRRKYTEEEYRNMILEAKIPKKLLDNNGLPLPCYTCIYDSFDQGLNRFIMAQEHLNAYLTALGEVRSGKKKTHWIWYIFPQMIGLGNSNNATFYGIKGRSEAKAYIEHPVLKARLIEITEAAYNNNRTVYEIFGADDIKFRSCMLLFASVCDEPIFKQVIAKYGWI